MRDEPELLEDQFTGFEAKGVGYVPVVDGNRSNGGGGVLTSDRDIRTGVMSYRDDGVEFMRNITILLYRERTKTVAY